MFNNKIHIKLVSLYKSELIPDNGIYSDLYTVRFHVANHVIETMGFDKIDDEQYNPVFKNDVLVFFASVPLEEDRYIIYCPEDTVIEKYKINLE